MNIKMSIRIKILKETDIWDDTLQWEAGLFFSKLLQNKNYARRRKMWCLKNNEHSAYFMIFVFSPIAWKSWSTALPVHVVCSE